jgi:hypothetical protein
MEVMVKSLSTYSPPAKVYIYPYWMQGFVCMCKVAGRGDQTVSAG